MNDLIRNIPNLLTMGNLACGLIGLERVLAGEPKHAIIAMLIAAVLDFFDGFTARLLKVSGEMGKQLDSLADLVTFGVLPGIIWYDLIMQTGYCTPTGFCTSRYAWVFIPLGAAWRLAKFNIDTRRITGFYGTPTPITGIVMASVWLAAAPQAGHQASWLESLYQARYFVLLAPLAAFYLMTSDLPMLALKFHKSDRQLMYKIALVAISVLLVILFQAAAGPVVLIFYVLISLLANFASLKQQHG